MKKIYIPLFAACVLLISSCSSKLFRPLYNTIPVVEINPYINIMELREVPATSFDSLKFLLFEEKVPDSSRNYKNSNYVHLNKSHSKPTVVVYLTDDVEKSIVNESIEVKQQMYFNYLLAEQEIEYAMLRNEFTILDHNKIKAAHKNLNNKTSNNDSLFSNNYNTFLLDGAQKLGCEYLLAVNDVSIEYIKGRNFSIQNIPAVVNFMKSNPDLQFGNLPNSIPTDINVPCFKAKLSARLLDVNTGGLAWVGNYEIESVNAEPLYVTFNVQKNVINGDFINETITTYNANLNLLNSQVAECGAKLISAYSQASKKNKFETTKELDFYESNLKNSIKDLEIIYNDKVSQLNKLNNQPPLEAYKTWSYSYVISEPILDPQLKSDTESNIYINTEKKHKELLIKKVINQLLETIELTTN
jgi:hypothetical protein